MTKELCGHPTPNGPCTMAKGHLVNYHRHRVYQNISWRIESTAHKVLHQGKSRVPLNYAIAESLKDNEEIVIHLKKWKDTRDISE